MAVLIRPTEGDGDTEEYDIYNTENVRDRNYFNIPPSQLPSLASCSAFSLASRSACSFISLSARTLAPHSVCRWAALSNHFFTNSLRLNSPRSFAQTSRSAPPLSLSRHSPGGRCKDIGDTNRALKLEIRYLDLLLNDDLQLSLLSLPIRCVNNHVHSIIKRKSEHTSRSRTRTWRAALSASESAMC